MNIDELKKHLQRPEVQCLQILIFTINKPPAWRPTNGNITTFMGEGTVLYGVGSGFITFSIKKSQVQDYVKKLEELAASQNSCLNENP
jgi:hypothetical protein